MKKLLIPFLLVVFLLLVISPVVNIFATEKQGEPLKIGVLGVMSGSQASWGLVCKYSAEAFAKMINDEGGFLLDGVRHKIEIISVDTKQDPKVAITGAKRLIYQDNIHYIIGPNSDNTCSSISPIIEEGGALNIGYGLDTKLFSPPHYNSILGMVNAAQSGSVIYKYLRDNEGVKTISFVARNQPNALNMREEGIKAAEKLGLEILSWQDTYEPDTLDFFPVVGKVIKNNPDLLVLSGASPGHGPMLVKVARQLGYKGVICTGTAQDIKIVNEIAGEYAEGFISVGGASAVEIRSKYMENFADVYMDIVGEWNDEAGTKVYALPMIIYTIQKAGKAALTDVEVFKEAIPKVAVINPFLKEEKILKYVGESIFGIPRQIGVPMVINTVKNGKFETLFIGSIED
jgi:branched-chain amino acid transport system substrate-binding protein